MRLPNLYLLCLSLSLSLWCTDYWFESTMKFERYKRKCGYEKRFTKASLFKFQWSCQRKAKPHPGRGSSLARAVHEVHDSSWQAGCDNIIWAIVSISKHTSDQKSMRAQWSLKTNFCQVKIYILITFSPSQFNLNLYVLDLYSKTSSSIMESQMLRNKNYMSFLNLIAPSLEVWDFSGDFSLEQVALAPQYNTRLWSTCWKT